MALEISGRLVQLLPVQTGTGKNGPWKKCDFVIETADKYPKKVCISAWNEQADQIGKVAINTELKVSFDVSSREYNGKWYSDIKAWKIAPQGAASSSANSSVSDEDAVNDALLPDEPANDLPF